MVFISCTLSSRFSRARHALSRLRMSWLKLVGAVLCVLIVSTNVQAQWGEDGGGSKPLLEQLDIYMGTGGGNWTYELTEAGEDEFTGKGGMVFAGIELIEPVLSIEQRFYSGSSEKTGGRKLNLEGAWSTVLRVNIALTQWNQVYVLGGVSAYHFKLDDNGTQSDKVNISSPSSGFGVTHRVSERGWIFVERFFYDGADGKFNAKVSGGAVFRF